MMNDPFSQWQENRNWAVISTETTGLSKEDQILEMALIHADGRILFDEIIKPTCSINTYAEKSHNISINKVKEKKKWSELNKSFAYMLQDIDKVLIFDKSLHYRMLKQTYLLNNIPFPNIKADCIMLAYMENGKKANNKINYKKLGELLDQQKIIITKKMNRAVNKATMVRQLVLGFNINNIS